MTLLLMQYIKVGVVGGSDLVKIVEQLGENGEIDIYGHVKILTVSRRQRQQ